MTKRWPLLVSVLALTGVVGGTLAGQLLAGPVSGPAVEDACADAEPVEYADATVYLGNADGEVSERIEVASSKNEGMHYLVYDMRSEELMGETIRLYHQPPYYSLSAAGQPQIVVTSYNRDLEHGEWTEWRVSERFIDASSDVGNAFCGYDMGAFNTFHYNGKERLDGVLTKKFTGTLQVLGDTDRWELWVDSAGRLVRNRRTVLGSESVIDTVVHGWGEQNVIKPPRYTPTPPPHLPAGTVLEAAFTVGITPNVELGFLRGYVGRLFPDDFSIDGVKTEVEGLMWSDGSVKLLLSPPVPLDGYVVEFIGPGGVVTLTLTDVKKSERLWSVPHRPWQDGDRLIVRIRENH